MLYQEHLDRLSEVFDYALDKYGPKSTPVSVEDFFKHLYVRRDSEDERQLRNAVTRARDITVVVAPLGAGKTTIIRNALRQCADDPNAYHVVDFKKLAARLRVAQTPPAAWPDRLQELIKWSIEKEKFGSVSVYRKWILEVLRLAFVSEYDELRLKYLASTRKPKMTDDEVMTLFRGDFDGMHQASMFVREHATVADTVRALAAVHKLDSFCLVFDNIDRLDVELQPYLLSLAVDVHRDGDSEFRTIIAVRWKNIMRYHESGSGGDTITLVSLASGAKHDARLVRVVDEQREKVPTDDFFENVMKQRHAYAELTAPVGEGTDKTFWVLFDSLRDRVNAKFIKERLHNLSNGCITEMLALNLGFMKYLFRLVDKGIVKEAGGVIHLTDTEINSYLYRWIAATANVNHELLCDTVEKYNTFEPKKALSSLSCDIEHVIMAWLLNNFRRRMRVKDVCSAFSSIGVPEESTHRALFELYERANPIRRYVELGDAEKRYRLTDLRDASMRVQLTTLGKEYVAVMLTKFEFLYQSLAYPQNVADDSEELLRPATEGTKDKFRIVSGHLALMSQVHTASITAIKTACDDSGIAWEPYYRRSYCVREQLIVERMMFDHLRHLARVDRPNLETYRSTYVSQLGKYFRDIGSTRDAERILSLDVVTA